jgi:prepilin-type N-terminal cleavage/methylation domain-containing protein
MRGSMGGFTLVEVMLALLLIAIGVLAAAPMFVHAMQNNAVGEDFGSAGALAVERMELLRSANYFSGLPAGGSLTINMTGYFDDSDPDYIVRWVIIDNASPVGTKTITVRVLASRQVVGLQKQVTLTTIRGM